MTNKNLLSPLEQCKRHNLEKCLPLVEPQHKEMIMPALVIDVKDYREALELEEVKQAIAAKGLEKVTVEATDKDGNFLPDILVATHDDVASGKLDEILKQKGWYLVNSLIMVPLDATRLIPYSATLLVLLFLMQNGY